MTKGEEWLVRHGVQDLDEFKRRVDEISGTSDRARRLVGFLNETFGELSPEDMHEAIEASLEERVAPSVRS